jgi:hypothetical protein
MMAQLSQRERVLATGVGTVVLLLLNVFIIGYFVKNQRRLRGEFATKTNLLADMKSRYAEKEMWAQRETWLKEKQPVLKNEGTAGGELLEEIREIAKKTNVQPLEPEIKTPERRPQYVSVMVWIDVKATAAALRDFLYEMQAPDRFIVFESANLQIDKDDKALMHGKFHIAKWFAPK